MLRGFKWMRLRTLVGLPPHEEICCIAMLVGDYQPIRCSCCRGRGWESRLWGVKTCPQCDGVGYDMMGENTRMALREVMERKNPKGASA